MPVAAAIAAITSPSSDRSARNGRRRRRRPLRCPRPPAAAAVSSMSTTRTDAPSLAERTRRRPADASATARDDGDPVDQTFHIASEPLRDSAPPSRSMPGKLARSAASEGHGARDTTLPTRVRTASAGRYSPWSRLPAPTRWSGGDRGAAPWTIQGDAGGEGAQGWRWQQSHSVPSSLLLRAD